jgi:multiple sugar transport system substrate-binding protein
MREDRKKPPTCPDRRAILRGVAGGALAAVQPSWAWATDVPIHDQVAAKARALAGADRRPLVVLGPVGAGANLRPVMERFTSATGIDVELIEEAPQNLNTQITLLAMTRTGRFDVALPTTNGLPDLASSGVIRPLDDFVARHEPAGLRDAVLFSVAERFDGKVYGFQTDGDVYLMYYKRSMLRDPAHAAAYEDRFGTPLQIAGTWEEQDQQMQFFHKPDKNQWGGLLFRIQGYFAWEWWSRFHAKGVWPFSPEMEAQIGSDEGVAALEDMIRATQYLHPATHRSSIFENWDLFFANDIFCNIGWGGAQKLFNRNNSENRGKLIAGLLPGMQDARTGDVTPISYFNWGKTYVVSASTDRPELSYLFALFASTPLISTLSIREAAGFFDPFREEHYQDPVIRDVYGDDFLAVHYKGMTEAIPDLYLKNQAEYFRVLDEAIGTAIAGELSARDSLTRAAQLWELVTSRSGRDQQAQRWAALRAKYPAHIAKGLRNTR